jgi:hypothetical protein
MWGSLFVVVVTCKTCWKLSVSDFMIDKISKYISLPPPIIYALLASDGWSPAWHLQTQTLLPIKVTDVVKTNEELITSNYQFLFLTLFLIWLKMSRYIRLCLISKGDSCHIKTKGPAAHHGLCFLFLFLTIHFVHFKSISK